IVLFVGSFVVSGVCFTKANENSYSKKVVDVALIHSGHTVRHLRGRHKENDEERAGVNAAAAMNLLHSNPGTSTKILHSVENNMPLSKWEKAILVLVGAGVISVTAYGSIKLLQLQSK
ncbi:RxLR effector protein, partial [Phytophthora megakarya]